MKKQLRYLAMGIIILVAGCSNAKKDPMEHVSPETNQHIQEAIQNQEKAKKQPEAYRQLQPFYDRMMALVTEYKPVFEETSKPLPFYASKARQSEERVQRIMPFIEDFETLSDKISVTEWNTDGLTEEQKQSFDVLQRNVEKTIDYYSHATFKNGQANQMVQKMYEMHDKSMKYAIKQAFQQSVEDYRKAEQSFEKTKKLMDSWK